MTQKIGLFPIFVAFVMMFGRPAGPGPGLWCVLGLSAGLEILLWGAHALHFDTGVRWGFSQRLKASSDGWYPLFTFSVQNIFILLTVAMFWLTLQEVGIPSSVWITVNVTLLALLIPGYRLAREMMQRNDDVKYVLYEKTCRYLIISLLTTLAFGSWLKYILPETGTPPPDALFRILVVGVGACLVILTCVALLLDFWFRRRKLPT